MRINRKQLEQAAAHLNMLTNSPLETYTRTAEGKLIANVGNFYISGAYGGFSLERVCNESGGASCPLHTGHIKAAELLKLINTFYAGIKFARQG